MEKKKEIFIGEIDYKNLSSNYYYVDKTLFIKDIIDRNAKVNLITRPRRFGKTLNMDMLQTFFEKTKKNNAAYFRDKKIWKEGTKYTSEQGKYPVIFMSFKDARCDTWEETYKNIVQVIVDEFSRHDELAKSKKVKKTDLGSFNSICAKTADSSTMSSAIQILTRMLHSHYGIEPIVLIDEYDEPIQYGYTNGYYKQAVSFIGDLFSKGLKDGKDMYFAVLTGILRVSKESIFSGLNNPVTYTVLDQKYSEYFGFTLDEVKEMLKYYDCGDKLDEVLEWYDGYMFGDTEIFNPFSLTNYIAKNCDAKDYWANTSGNGILSDLLKNANKNTEEKLVALLQGETISCAVDENVVYADLNGGNEQIFSVLLFSGYLKSLGKDPETNKKYLMKIPNKEVGDRFETEIIKKLQGGSGNLLSDIWGSLQEKNAVKLEELLKDYLLGAISVYDIGGKTGEPGERAENEYEAFYHGMWLGFAAYKRDSYYARSNRESGDGRADIIMEPMKTNEPGIILEFKRLKESEMPAQDDSDKSLRVEAKKALNQIDDKRYDADLKDRGCKNIIKAGIAYLGKDVAVAM